MKKFTNLLKNSAVIAMTSAPAIAMASGGGLNEATDALNGFKTWLYGFLAVASLVYICFQAGMAMADKIAWADVGMAVGKVAAVGGILVVGQWAWGIWGS